LVNKQQVVEELFKFAQLELTVQSLLDESSHLLIEAAIYLYTKSNIQGELGGEHLIAFSEAF
jgi:hypothetical protein